jgi:TolB-like protein
MLMAGAANAQDKMKIAVMDFNPGVGVDASMVNGLSDMLINSLFETRKFTIVERTQLDKAIQEIGFQKSNLSAGQIAKVGKILGVKFVLVGTVNFIATERTTEQVTTGMISGEFNLDVRIVDVESGEIVSTAGVTKSGAQTYRSLMPELAKDITSKLSSSNGSGGVVVLLGYLYVFPEDLGNMTYREAKSALAKINAVNPYGYSDWRLPTSEELSMMMQKRDKLQMNEKYYGADIVCKHDQEIWCLPAYGQCCYNSIRTAQVRPVRTNR